MNIERFHNELALRLSYERIVKDKRILISVEESDDPCVILKLQGYDDIRFKASGNANEIGFRVWTGMNDEIQVIADAVHQAYIMANKTLF